MRSPIFDFCYVYIAYIKATITIRTVYFCSATPTATMEFSRVLLLTVFYSFTCAGASNNNWDDWAQQLNWEKQQHVSLYNQRKTVSQRVQQHSAGISPYVSNSANYYNPPHTFDPHPTFDPRPAYDPRPTFDPHPTFDSRPAFDPRPTFEPHPSFYSHRTFYPRRTFNPRHTFYETEFNKETPEVHPQFSNRLGDLHNLDNVDNFGGIIGQQVYASLRPVREMEAKLKIKFGKNGTTITTFKDKQFIVIDGVFYECEGTISEEDGFCSGNLCKSSFETPRDFCYANINTIINDWYCISPGAGAKSGIINGKGYCNASEDNPALFISAEDYKNLCDDVRYPVTYKYFGTDPIGDHSSDVICSSGIPYTCTYTTDRNSDLGISGPFNFVLN